MSQLLGIERFIYSALSADAGITAAVGTRIYAHLAPDAASSPLIVFQRQAGRDITHLGNIRGYSEEVYLVKAIGEVAFSAIDPIADLIDSALHGATDDNEDGVIYSSTRDSSFSLVTNERGVTYYHRGGVYRILANGK